MKYRKFAFYLSFVAFSLGFSACSSDDDGNGEEPAPPPAELEGEITSAMVILEDAEGVQLTQSFVYHGPDANGGDPPAPNTISTEFGGFLVTTRFYDATDLDNPVNLSGIVEEQGTEYQVFYEFLNGADEVIFFEYADTDADGNPLGLFTLWGASAATAGSEFVRVTLLKGLNKNAPGASAGVISGDLGGEVVLEAEFPLIVF